ncbi:MAG: DUF115 domain-containing protein [Desulfobacteraceae bacterium]|nr:DUF115 domain-containing protein [Desulfobacteraceae bacterium]
MKNSFLEKNLAALKKNFPDIYKITKKHQVIPPGKVMEASDGLLNLKYDMPSGENLLAYSLENTRRDAAIHLETIPPDSAGVAVFIGMGLGYGPIIVLKERPNLCAALIIEPSIDMFMTAMKHVDLTSILESSRVHLQVGGLDLALLERQTGREVAIMDTHILLHVPSFLWQKDLYEKTRNDAFMLLNKLNTMGSTTNYCGDIFIKNRLEALSLISSVHNTDILYNRFPGRPALLVAAGPSLDLSLPLIKKAQGKCIIIAVDSALNAIIKAGITPDFVTSLDMEDPNFEKVAAFLDQKWPFSLVTTVKCTPLIAKRFPAKHTFFAFNMDTSHIWLINLLKIKHFFPPMLSVAHISIGLALLMGADPILLVGQDLAYTSTGSDHAADAVFHEIGLPKDKEIFYTKGIDGAEIPTDRGLLSLKKQFEDIIGGSKRRFINVSARGAHIEGTEVMSLEQAIDRYMPDGLATQKIMDDIIACSKKWQPSEVISFCDKTIKRMNELSRKLKTAADMTSNGLKQIKLLMDKGCLAASMADLPSGLKAKLIKTDQLNNATDAYSDIMNQIVESTFQALKENDVRHIKNMRLKKEQGYLPWLKAELERMGWVQPIRLKAIENYMSRLEALRHRLAEEERLKKTLKTADTPGTRLKLAELYSDANDILLARDEIEKILDSGVQNPEIYAQMGFVCAGLLDFEQAKYYWNKAVSQDTASAAYIQALKLKAASPWIEAVKKQEYIARPDGSYPKWGERYPHLLAKWVNRINESAGGEDTIIHKITEELWPDYAIIIENMIEKNDMEKAGEILEAWSPVKEHLFGYAYFNSRILYANGEPVLSVKELSKDLGVLEGEPKRLAFAARLMLETSQFGKGIELLGKAVALDKNTATLWEELGDSLSSSGNHENAIVAYEQYRNAMPEKIDILRKIGDSYLALGQLEAAKNAYEILLDHKRKNSRTTIKR